MSASPRRRSLVPRSAIVAGVVIVVLIGGAIAAGILYADSRLVEVPEVTGLPIEVAKRALEVSSLAVDVAGTRVSVEMAAGLVLSQDPEPGTAVRRGTAVTIVLSAGPQTVLLPDLVGRDVEEARTELTTRGLAVSVVGVSAEASAGIVLEMFPSPGSAVNVGDTVRLSVAGAEASDDLLLPYDLSSLSIALDPSPVASTDAVDPALDVARRLAALLQAASAEVIVTRSATETAPAPARRLEIATTSGATLLIGLDVSRTGEPGLVVYHRQEAGTEPAAFVASRDLAAEITRAARLPGILVREPAETADSVVAGFPGRAVRVTVGDITSDADLMRMTDPAWADRVARAIYRAVGTAHAAD